MTLILSGTNGVSDIDGSAATPAIRGTDANTGIFFPAADTIAFSEGGVESMRIDSSGNVGIGTASLAGYRISVKQSGNTSLASIGIASINSANDTYIGMGYHATTDTCRILASYDSNGAYKPISFWTSDAERMRIDSSGNLLVGTTSLPIASTKVGISSASAVGLGIQSFVNTGSSTKKWSIGPDSNGNFVVFNDASAGVFVTYGGTSWTANSDERLKTQLIPFQNAVEKVSTLRAGTGRYLTDDESVSRSFLIAQDVQKVLPEAVSVQNDEIKTLGLQYTEVIPLLVAAIQEQQIIIQSLTTRIAVLEAK